MLVRVLARQGGTVGRRLWDGVVAEQSRRGWKRGRGAVLRVLLEWGRQKELKSLVLSGGRGVVANRWGVSVGFGTSICVPVLSAEYH